MHLATDDMLLYKREQSAIAVYKLAFINYVFHLTSFTKISQIINGERWTDCPHRFIQIDNQKNH